MISDRFEVQPTHHFIEWCLPLNYLYYPHSESHSFAFKVIYYCLYYFVFYCKKCFLGKFSAEQ